jgi:ketosteroid isomerase-like protein
MRPERALRAEWVAASLLAGLIAIGCAAPQPANTQDEYAQEKSQIAQRLQEVITACESKDFTRLDSYHLYGPRFTKFSNSSPAILDAAAAKEGEHRGLGAATGLRMRADSLNVDVFGNVGIATFILDYSFQSGGQTLSRKERSTLVFVRDAGQWRIIHEHLSPIKE